MEKERGAFGVSLHDGLFAAVLGMREFVDEAIWSGSSDARECCVSGGAFRLANHEECDSYVIFFGAKLSYVILYTIILYSTVRYDAT